MFIKNTYKFEKDGVIGLACGYKPEDCEILEEIKILYAQDGFELYEGEENLGGAVCLINGKTAEDFTEKEIKQVEEK